MQEEQGQTPAVHNDLMQSITGTSNDTDTRIGGASGGDTEKAGQKSDSAHCTVYRKQKIS